MGAVKINAADHLGLVHKIAGHYRNSNVEYEDLVQEGVVGLMRAIQKFDPKNGAKFSTYAQWWIRAAIGQFLATQPIVHMSAKTQRKARVAGTMPTQKRLDAVVGHDGPSIMTWHDLLSDGAASPEEELAKKETEALLRKRVQALPKRTRRMIVMRFDERKTLGEIAEAFDISRERVRQILERAFDVLYVGGES